MLIIMIFPLAQYNSIHLAYENKFKVVKNFLYKNYKSLQSKFN